MLQLKSLLKKEKPSTKIDEFLGNAKLLLDFLEIFNLQEVIELKSLLTSEELEKSIKKLKEIEQEEDVDIKEVRDLVTCWKDIFSEKDLYWYNKYSSPTEEVILLYLKSYWGDEAAIVFDKENWTATCSAPCKETITIKG